MSKPPVRPGVSRSLICLSLAAQLTAGGCRPPAAPAPTVPAAPAAAPSPTAVPAAPPTDRPEVPLVAAPAGHLTAELPDPRAAGGEATSAPLSDAEAQQLLARLPPLPVGAGPAPAVRPPSAPPPRAGAVQPIAFAIPTGKPVADAPIAPIARPAAPPPPLAPPQISPEGEREVESEVRIRFSEPMVPVAEVGAAAQPPVSISPQVPGSWRWIDTRVLTFTAQGRFPGSTQFVVTVPGGVRAASGATLAEAVRTSFTTRPVQLTGVRERTSRLDGPLTVTFDQRVDPDRIVAALAVVGPNGASLPFRVISRDEARPRWRANPSLADEPDGEDEPHVILAPQAAWPAGISARVLLRPGAGSLEGPRTTTRASGASFHVAAPFTVRGITCGEQEAPQAPRLAGRKCPSGSYATLELSNRIHAPSLRAGVFQLDGKPLDGTMHSDGIGLVAPGGPGRTAAVDIGDGLTDIYGQALAGPRRATFVIAPARSEPLLDAPAGLHVLDPRFEIPQWVVHAEAVPSVRIELYRVEPRDYFAFAAFERGERRATPGRRVLDQTHAVGPRTGANVRVDLRPALGAAGLGHAIAIATAAGRAGLRRVAWIQVTKLGVSARTDRERVHAWAHDVSPARLLAPRAGVEAAILVEGAPETARATTDAAGHAAFDLPAPRPRPAAPPQRGAPLHRAAPPDERGPIALLLATSGDDATFTALDGPHERATRRHNAYWYATDDRFTYRPGERVHVKGWIRWTHDGVNPDLALPAAGEGVAYTLTDARGNQVAAGRAPLSDHGGFDLTVELPPEVNLGRARFSFATRGQTHDHAISIQEFRSPAFAVTLTEDVTHGGALPLVAGERIEMSAAAAYYAGGGLPGARIEWTAYLSRASYVPPGWDEFSFTPVPRTREDAAGWQYHRGEPDYEPHRLETAGALSGASSAAIVFGVGAVPDGRPATLIVDAVVADVDRARIRARSRPILVHPSGYYVGLRLRPGDTGTLEAIATDLDGRPVPGVAIDLEIEGVSPAARYRADAKILDTQRCRLTSDAAPVACPFQRKPDVTYAATARISDARGRPSAAYFAVPWHESGHQRNLSVVPDRGEYRLGDVAKLEIRSERFPAAAVVTLARQGVISQRRVELTALLTTIEVPIEAAMIPNVHVVVDRYATRAPATGGVPPQQQQQSPQPLQPLPDVDTVELDLSILLDSARLAVRARPARPLVEPGAPATFEVSVRHGGKPVAGAEVALMVIDEAVLAVSRRSHADPLAPFYRSVDQGTWSTSTLPLVTDAAEDLAGAPGVTRYSLDADGARGRFGIGSGRGGMRGHATASPAVALGGAAAVKVRKDFRPDAAFAPRLVTGPDGRATLTVDMPDSLTRFRVIALATAGTRFFGKDEGAIVTQRKLSARTVAPRFLTQGDAFSLPVVVQNLDSHPRTVDVAVRAANLTAAGPAGRRVTIPAGGRAEVRFDFAARARGKATIQTLVAPVAAPGVAPGGDADASSIELPVYAPATTEAFATYGTVDDAPRFEQLAVPADVFPDVGGVEVELASTQLQSLTDAYWYLYAYPYECAEQRSSRMLATAALADLLDAFAAPGRPARAEIDATIASDLRILSEHQRDDGGWGYFHGTRSDPFVTLQVLAALTAHAPAAHGAVKRAAAFAEREAAAQLAALERAAAMPAERREDAGALAYRVGLAAHALAVLGGTRADVRARAERLHAAAIALGAYPLDAKARLLAAVAKQPRAAAMRARLLRDLGSSIQETAAAATVTVRFDERERPLLGSGPKSTALVLDALLREAPEHALVTKLVRGVLDARRGGRWASTQENLVALTALRRYFDTHEKAAPTFTGRVWLGGAAYAEQAFAGRSAGRGAARLGWDALTPGGTHDVAIAKAGDGRLYYRLGITYAPRRANLPALDAGFVVRRAYTAIDHPGDVTRTADGRYQIRLGARVRVTIEAVSTSPRHAVAVVDPLPAGLEAVNESLATSERAGAPAGAPGDTGWDHVAMRDNRSEVFAMNLPPGRHQLSYTARASTPGTFLAAPAKAEEMYSPETFGRSAGATVVIE